jgi:hypothetical protein
MDVVALLLLLLQAPPFCSHDALLCCLFARVPVLSTCHGTSAAAAALCLAAWPRSAQL